MFGKLPERFLDTQVAHCPINLENEPYYEVERVNVKNILEG